MDSTQYYSHLLLPSTLRATAPLILSTLRATAPLRVVSSPAWISEPALGGLPASRANFPVLQSQSGETFLMRSRWRLLSNLLSWVYEFFFISAAHCLCPTVRSPSKEVSPFLECALSSLAPRLSPLRFLSGPFSPPGLRLHLPEASLTPQADCPRSSRKSYQLWSHWRSCRLVKPVARVPWTDGLLALGAPATSPSSLSAPVPSAPHPSSFATPGVPPWAPRIPRSFHRLRARDTFSPGQSGTLRSGCH